jgi:hypothetical protein
MTIAQDPEKPVEREVLATAITKISEGMQALLKSGLNRDAIIVLLHDRTRLPKSTLNTVLNGLAQLKRDYTTL